MEPIGRNYPKGWYGREDNESDEYNVINQEPSFEHYLIDSACNPSYNHSINPLQIAHRSDVYIPDGSAAYNSAKEPAKLSTPSVFRIKIPNLYTVLKFRENLPSKHQLTF